MTPSSERSDAKRSRDVSSPARAHRTTTAPRDARRHAVGSSGPRPARSPRPIAVPEALQAARERLAAAALEVLADLGFVLTGQTRLRLARLDAVHRGTPERTAAVIPQADLERWA